MRELTERLRSSDCEVIEAKTLHEQNTELHRNLAELHNKLRELETAHAKELQHATQSSVQGKGSQCLTSLLCTVLMAESMAY